MPGNDFDTCTNGGCMGLIEWDESLCYEAGNQTPPPYKAGRCSSCTAFHIKCGDCNSLEFFAETPGEVPCQGCEMRWRISIGRDELTVRQLT